MNHLTLCLGICILLSACSGNNKPPPDPQNDSGLFRDQSITISDNTRNYHLYVPQEPDNAPIILLLHGNSGSSDQLLGLTGDKAPFKLWLEIAAQENLVLVVPDGVEGSNGKQGWNDCRTDAKTNPAVDDLLFLDSLIDSVQERFQAQESKIFVSGISNGALMAMRLAEELPDKLQALSIIVASRPVNSECPASNVPVPVLIMNGTSDPILPYEGGAIASDRGEVFSTPETVNYWVNRNQADEIPVESVIPDIDKNDNSTVRRFTYGNGQNSSIVDHYEVTNGGHTEPSIAEPYGNVFKLIVGNQNRDIEMANEVWEFFKSVAP